MSESLLKAYDPLAYYVNSLEELDRDVCNAYLKKDNLEIKRLISTGNTTLDVYICVTKHHHAFILCAPSAINPEDPFSDMLTDDVNQIPHLLLCWTFELRFENPSLKTYKISKEFKLFKDIEQSIKYSYYIGKYKDVAPKALQFAAIRAAPHRYKALLDDCVEFAKEFCICLLSYCNNGKAIEKDVEKSIREASATGLSIERLSRNIRSSGIFGNSFLVGLDFSSYAGQLGARGLTFAILFFVVFIVIYPVVAAYIVYNFLHEVN